MILSRYLTREVFGSLLAVTFILLLIFLSNQLVRLLSYAAAGKLAANLLVQLLGFEVPYLLAILLPLGLYLGIILAYGRLYAENELSVMQACGLSQVRLTAITYVLVSIVTTVIFILTFWVNPHIAEKKERALAQGMSAENILANLTAGRFQVSSDGRRVVYVEHISSSHKTADNLFFADQIKTPAEENSPTVWSVVSGAKGYQAIDQNSNRHFLVAESGYRYEGIPGQNDYKIIQFKKYAVQIPGMNVGVTHHETEAIPTKALWEKYHDPYDAAELQWRLSVPLSAFLLSWLAVMLSRVEPRQGRYSHLLPAVLIYVVYMNLLFAARNWIEQKTISITIGIWWVHLAFICVVLGALIVKSRTVKRFLRRA